MSESQPVFILGAGAIGSLWACSLAHSGVETRLIPRRVSDDSITLTLTHQGQNITQSIPQQSAKQISRITNLLICVKSYQLEQALLSVQHAVNAQSRVILLQNGMGHKELAQKHLPHAQLFLASNTHGVFRQSQHQFVHAGWGKTLLGPANINTQAPEALLAQLHQALPAVTWEADITPLLWRKLAVNAVINPLTALYDCNNGALLEHTEWRQQMHQLVIEMRPVIEYQCPALKHYDFVTEIESVAATTAMNYSSMHQDYHLGRRTEIDQISGYLLNKASEQGVVMPTHQDIYLRLTQPTES
ncbi:2-dehydropantoate 2-reductase [Pleionea sp. CnH1-48]|uniref:ketopantoate reductase family protein n=1 Tax=Pleionea sp. CnH1-48 TaxID=2954494 RepID=UPI002097F3E5|nr:2-dehydropantoate 2-reductase [Pleionea sp. CnH1-48]